MRRTHTPKIIVYRFGAVRTCTVVYTPRAFGCDGGGECGNRGKLTSIRRVVWYSRIHVINIYICIHKSNPLAAYGELLIDNAWPGSRAYIIRPRGSGRGRVFDNLFRCQNAKFARTSYIPTTRHLAHPTARPPAERTL